MWALFTASMEIMGVFDSLANAERAKGELVVKYNCGTSAYCIKEMVLNKIYD